MSAGFPLDVAVHVYHFYADVWTIVEIVRRDYNFNEWQQKNLSSPHSEEK